MSQHLLKINCGLLIITSALALTACGQKGPLVLPNKPVLKPNVPPTVPTQSTVDRTSSGNNVEEKTVTPSPEK